jgi:hypothetical protein
MTPIRFTPRVLYSLFRLIHLGLQNVVILSAAKNPSIFSLTVDRSLILKKSTADFAIGEAYFLSEEATAGAGAAGALGAAAVVELAESAGFTTESGEELFESPAGFSPLDFGLALP